MKIYKWVFFFVLFHSASYAQKSSESYQDTLVIRTLIRVLNDPQYPDDSTGILVIKIEKAKDSLMLESVYNSMNRYSLPSDVKIKSRLSLKDLNSIPDGYKRIITVNFHFSSDNGKLSLPAEEINLLAKKNVDAYDGKIKILDPIIRIESKPSYCPRIPKQLIPMKMPGLL